MKIRRFLAGDMRQAIRQVREALGPDAVILSNKSVQGGVEIVAAVDLEQAGAMAAEMEAAPRQPEPQRQPETPRPAPATAYDATPAASYTPAQQRPAPSRTQQPAAASAEVTPLRRPVEDRVGEDRPTVARGTERPSERPDERRAAAAQPAAAQEADQQAVIAEMRREMAELKTLMKNGLSELGWQSMGEHQPVRQELLRRLMTLGLSAENAQGLAARVDSDDPELAWRKALFHLAGELTMFDEDLMEQGGIVAVVGPTGVGKTTTIAKLAARYALRHGRRHLALVTTDNFRIGARDQLHTYGRILNVPVHSVANAEELETVLNSLSDRRLVLVDTAGMGQHDQRLHAQIRLLQKSGRQVRSLLALSATTEPMAMERAIQLFSDARPEACILTKLDEAASLGGALNALIRSGLPLAYITDGQQVPEDLHIGRAHPLVSRAAELTREHEVACDPTYLALAYGSNLANAHA